MWLIGYVTLRISYLAKETIGCWKWNANKKWYFSLPASFAVKSGLLNPWPVKFLFFFVQTNQLFIWGKFQWHPFKIHLTYDGSSMCMLYKDQTGPKLKYRKFWTKKSLVLRFSIKLSAFKMWTKHRLICLVLTHKHLIIKDFIHVREPTV